MLTECLLFAAISWFAFYVNRGIAIRGLYMDDLYMWSCYGEQSLLEFAFPIGTSTRFRPVYWLATYLQMMIVGPHISRFAAFNIILNIGAAWMIRCMGGKLSGSRAAGFMAALAYLASRFAYYQIGQALGLMETMALVFALVILWLLYLYMTGGRTAGPGERDRAADRHYYGALLVYFLLAFTHERYISLLPLFYLVTLLSLVRASAGGFARKGLKEVLPKWLWGAAVLALIVLIRALAIGKAIPAGTGGTQVTETFRIGEFLGYCLSQVYYIFGINAGPEHLNGLPWDQTPAEIRSLVKGSILAAGMLVLLYFWRTAAALRRQELLPEDRRPEAGEGILFTHFSAWLLFCGFIGLCIACSSVTIRVEMRWIYVSYAAALLFACWMTGRISESGTGKAAALILLGCYTALSIWTNLFYRQYFPKLYFWPNQLRMNSLAGETVEKYGTAGVFGKEIYILENSYGMSDFYARTFFKTFDPQKQAQGTVVIFAESLDQVPMDKVRRGEALVLEEVPEENAYRDMTEELRQ